IRLGDELVLPQPDLGGPRAQRAEVDREQRRVAVGRVLPLVDPRLHQALAGHDLAVLAARHVASADGVDHDDAVLASGARIGGGLDDLAAAGGEPPPERRGVGPRGEHLGHGRGKRAHDREGGGAGHAAWWRWLRLPQVSSNTATTTGPCRVGGARNTTPRAARRSCSAWMSAEPNDVAGMPSSNMAFWYVRAAGWAFGSRRTSTPAAPSGEATVNQRCSPRGMSLCFTNPRTSV